MTGLKLHEATAALHIAEDWLDEAGGELTPEVEALLEQAEGDFATKVERVALKVLSLTAEAEAIKAEESRLAARRKARENGAKSLKDYLARCLESAGKDTVKGVLVTVAFQSNPPSLNVPDGANLKELFEAGTPGIEHVPATFVVSKRVMLDAVKAKDESVLPAGWTVTRGRSLRIR